ncbi:hypothetical protein [Lactiplantibacillus plantarum]|uniref:hypothetical protein n=1 Tax=Lactiplantibacillus plantarum TaxID=1590 RepID=UPI0009B5122E|nr:hypothetical protein [Lactiplantibacillus plantarum]
MQIERFWEVFHGQDLDRLVDKAHEDAPFSSEVNQVQVQYLNNEYVLTAIYEHAVNVDD